MAKVFSVFMQKGGVGKTTITFLLAYELAKQGKTLVIDGDQQGNFTMLCDNPKFENHDFLSVLQEKSTVRESITKSHHQNVDLYFMGTKKNDSLFKQYIESSFREDPTIIKRILIDLKEEGFQYIFIDLPPSYGFYEKIVLSQVNEIIPIIEPAEMAVTGFLQLYKNLQKHKVGYECTYVFDKLIINKTNSQKKANEHWLNQMRKTPDFKIFEIADSKAISNCTDLHVPLQEYHPSNSICTVLSSLATDIK